MIELKLARMLIAFCRTLYLIGLVLAILGHSIWGIALGLSNVVFAGIAWVPAGRETRNSA